MKIRDSIRFPHPVLRSDGDDYAEPGFDISVEVGEVEAAGHVQVVGNLSVGSAAVAKLISASDVDCGLFVVCHDTYFNEIFPISNGVWRISFDAGALRGSVSIRAIAYAKRDLLLGKEFLLNEEYSADGRRIRQHDIVAMSRELRFDVGYEKLAPMESIFRLVRNDEVPEGEYLVDYSGESIQICVPDKLHSAISAMRGTRDGRSSLLNGVYLPCLVQVLPMVEGDEFADKRWRRVLEAKARQLGLRLGQEDALASAQSLLKQPAKIFEKIVEGGIK